MNQISILSYRLFLVYTLVLIESAASFFLERQTNVDFINGNFFNNIYSIAYIPLQVQINDCENVGCQLSLVA